MEHELETPASSGIAQRRRWLNRFFAGASLLLIGAMVVRGAHDADVKADLRIVVREAKALEQAFQDYHQRNGGYPNSYASPAFDEMTLDPLRRRGYYDGQLTSALLNGRLDAYHSPEDRGLNQEYWAEMTLARDSSIRVLVVRSDDAPLGGGVWLEGVYVYSRGELRRV